jgi:hypothetical protein
MLPRLKQQPGVSVVTMDDAGASDDFSDEVHPKPRVTPRWAQRLADELATTARAAKDARSSPQLARTPS